jgi:hypothetical protein
LSKKPTPILNGEIELEIGWTPSEKEEMKKHGVKLLHERCDKLMAKSKHLPLNSYLIHYKLNEVHYYDIVQTHARVKAFDVYYDKYGKDTLVSITWTDGRVNPKLYGATKPDEPKKKRR